MELLLLSVWNLIVRMFFAVGFVVSVLFWTAWSVSPLSLSLEFDNEPSLIKACIWAATGAVFAAGLATHGRKETPCP